MDKIISVVVLLNLWRMKVKHPCEHHCDLDKSKPLTQKKYILKNFLLFLFVRDSCVSDAKFAHTEYFTSCYVMLCHITHATSHTPLHLSCVRQGRQMRCSYTVVLCDFTVISSLIHKCMFGCIKRVICASLTVHLISN